MIMLRYAQHRDLTDKRRLRSIPTGFPLRSVTGLGHFS